MFSQNRSKSWTTDIQQATWTNSASTWTHLTIIVRRIQHLNEESSELKEYGHRHSRLSRVLTSLIDILDDIRGFLLSNSLAISFSYNFDCLREGWPVQMLPKFRHCLNGGGGWPLPGFLWRICPHALRALKGDHSSPKSDNFPTKMSLFSPETTSI